MRIVHVVVTDAFAGTERYVAEVAKGCARLGHDVVVVGGDVTRMRGELDGIEWHPGGTMSQALRVLLRLPPADLLHAHLTQAETVAVTVGLLCGVPVVSTRHIARRRGSSAPARALSRLLNRRLRQQLAISDFVAQAIEVAPDAVLPNSVADADQSVACPTPRVVLMAQRLEPEKDTATALRAWSRSSLPERGWELHVAGAGSERAALERLVAAEAVQGVRFVGLVDDIAARLQTASGLLATAPAEPLGLTVLEAMAAGVPVVATGAGGHLESLPPGYPLLFSPGDVRGAASALDALVDPESVLLGRVLRQRQQERFSHQAHLGRLLGHYEAALRLQASS